MGKKMKKLLLIGVCFLSFGINHAKAEADIPKNNISGYSALSCHDVLTANQNRKTEDVFTTMGLIIGGVKLIIISYHPPYINIMLPI